MEPIKEIFYRKCRNHGAYASECDQSVRSKMWGDCQTIGYFLRDYLQENIDMNEASLQWNEGYHS